MFSLILLDFSSSISNIETINDNFDVSLGYFEKNVLIATNRCPPIFGNCMFLLSVSFLTEVEKMLFSKAGGD